MNPTVEEQVKILRLGVDDWNLWRARNPHRTVDLFEANLREAQLDCWANLREADLTRANMQQASLWHAILIRANLREAHLEGASLNWALLEGAHLEQANLEGADLSGAYLKGAKLRKAILGRADLTRAYLDRADLSGANLSGACLEGAQFIRADLCDATLTGSSVYGVSVWDLIVNDVTKQQNLIITDRERGESVITVDNIKVAQLVYLLLENKEIRDVIDTIGKKAVLILGRFSDERKPVLDALRDELRKHDYLPIMFDFASSARQSTVETVTTLARMARFVIADLTDARSVLMELQAIVPDLPSVAVRLLIKKSEHEYGMLDFIRRYKSVIENTYEYDNVEDVIASIKENIIGPAEAKVQGLRPRA